eukprot:NODE_450_length_3038_cov_5.602542.p1 GENE.NODE_450_length_3038_cov_5.602542~~NODE_450_length_3038_cov_5.602542.p1  ORF type:complete len:331 (-),score=75.75 NODE_450_length_3038_cov_5.602542:252-1244(-)
MADVGGSMSEKSRSSTEEAAGDTLRLLAEEEVQRRWRLVEILGKTKLSEVWLCAEGGGEALRVLKRIDKLAYARSRTSGRHSLHVSLRSEVELLAGLRHESIVMMCESFETESHLYLAMEYMAGGDLCDCICMGGPFVEADASRVMRPLCAAISYLHSCDIVHRDLKTENVLLNSRVRANLKLKLADFGLSRPSARSRDCLTYCGTRAYIAPEVVMLTLRWRAEVDGSDSACHTTADYGSGGYGKPADLWSLGVMLYVVLSGVPPFDLDEDSTSLYRRIIRGLYEFDVPAWNEVSPEAKALVASLMKVEPGERLSIGGVLENSWFKCDHV